MAGPSGITIELIASQPPDSVTVTVLTPPQSALLVGPAVDPSSHKYVFGFVPPKVKAEARPLHSVSQAGKILLKAKKIKLFP